MSKIETKAFPEGTRTLAINGIGQKGAVYVEQFLMALKATGGLDEVIGISLMGVHEVERQRLRAIFQEPRNLSPFWRQLFSTRPAERTTFTPSISLNDTAESAGSFVDFSQKQGDSLRAVFILFHTKEVANG